jgi:peptidoglycan/LPS O-acetylase OafA/YrhL
VVLILFIAILFYNSNYEYFKIDPEPTFKYYIRDFVIATGSCIIIIIVIAKQRMAQFFQKSIFVFLGEISYGFYLIHMPVLFTMCSVFSYTSPLSYLYIFLATLVVSIGLSAIVYNVIEMPFQRAAKWLVKKFEFLNTVKLS